MKELALAKISYTNFTTVNFSQDQKQRGKSCYWLESSLNVISLTESFSHVVGFLKATLVIKLTKHRLQNQTQEECSNKTEITIFL